MYERQEPNREKQSEKKQTHTLEVCDTHKHIQMQAHRHTSQTCVGVLMCECARVCMSNGSGNSSSGELQYRMIL